MYHTFLFLPTFLSRKLQPVGHGLALDKVVKYEIQDFVVLFGRRQREVQAMSKRTNSATRTLDEEYN